jgi:tetrahydromethanopterin S-methyltransferase subunit D
MPKMDDKISAGSHGPQPPSVRHCDGLGSGQARSLATGEGPTDIVTANLIAASKRALTQVLPRGADGAYSRKLQNEVMVCG